MGRYPAWIVCLLSLNAIAACGGGDKKKPEKPEPEEVTEKAPPPKETEADRAKQRTAAAREIVPEGSDCLPAAWKAKPEEAPHFQIAPAGGSPVLCAVDHDKERALGPIACWKVALDTGALTYQEAKPLPGRGFSVKLHDNCAWSFCLPPDAKAEGDTALVVWNEDGSKAAVVAAGGVHLFETAGNAHEKSFSLKADKGITNDPVGVAWVGDTFFIEGADAGPYSAVWAYKADGTAVGPIEELGAKEARAVSTYGGSFLVLDKERVAVSSMGLSTLTTYDVATGKRAKVTRKVAKPACKAEELDGYWHEATDKVGDKCKADLEKTHAPFVGADALAGKNNHLFALRGPRLGELAVIEPKALTERKDKLIKLKWCGGDDADAAAKE